MKFECTPEEFKNLCSNNTNGVSQVTAPPAPPVYSTDVFVKLLKHLSCGEKINAIKELRRLTCCGLAEAKDIVEGTCY